MSVEATVAPSWAELTQPCLTTTTLEIVYFDEAAQQGASAQSMPLPPGQVVMDQVMCWGCRLESLHAKGPLTALVPIKLYMYQGGASQRPLGVDGIHAPLLLTHESTLFSI
jgi:hypothetical protein